VRADVVLIDRWNKKKAMLYSAMCSLVQLDDEDEGRNMMLGDSGQVFFLIGVFMPSHPSQQWVPGGVTVDFHLQQKCLHTWTATIYAVYSNR